MTKPQLTLEQGQAIETMSPFFETRKRSSFSSQATPGRERLFASNTLSTLPVVG